MRKSTTTDARSDEQLLESVRAGDTEGFGELWRRHARSGQTVARRFTSSLDSDDLVAEAFTSIYQSTVAGGGPVGAFRPYLYTTIRNLACTWGRARRELAVDDLAEFADPATLGDAAVTELDSSLTAEAFRALPARWQAVLWYTEVERMDPHEVAPLLGLTANGVSALAYRAREGLRTSWLQAHITDSTAAGSCRWTIGRLGDHARRRLSKRESARVDEHLGVCGRCSAIASELEDVSTRIAAIMVPLLVGGGVTSGALGAELGTAGATLASELAAPALPQVYAAVSAPGSAFGGAGIAAAPATAAASVGLLGGTAALTTASGGVLTAALAAVAIVGSVLVGPPSTAGPNAADLPAAGRAATAAGGTDSVAAAAEPDDVADLSAAPSTPDPAAITPVPPAEPEGTPTSPGVSALDGVTDGATGLAGDAVGGVTHLVGGLASAVPSLLSPPEQPSALLPAAVSAGVGVDLGGGGAPVASINAGVTGPGVTGTGVTGTVAAGTGAGVTLQVEVPLVPGAETIGVRIDLLG